MDLITTLGACCLAFTAAFTAHQYLSADPGAGAQSRRASLIEAWTNIVSGFVLNYIANLFFLPLVGAELTLANNFWLGWLYTAVSILRQYAIRRWFNGRRFAEWLARRLSA